MISTKLQKVDHNFAMVYQSNLKKNILVMTPIMFQKKTTNEFKSYIKYKDAISENPIML